MPHLRRSVHHIKLMTHKLELSRVPMGLTVSYSRSPEGMIGDSTILTNELIAMRYKNVAN